MNDFGFETGRTVFIVFALVILGIILAAVVQGISRWNKNNHSPRLTADASVTSKREDVSIHRHGMAGDVTGSHTVTSSTTYYVTFQFESGDRQEFCVSGTEYGMLAEGDRGKLSFQGTRYLGFERI